MVGAARSRATDAPSGAVTARRLGAARWRDPRLAIGIVLVAASVVLGVRVVDAADDTVAVWSLRADAPAGTELSAADLVPARVHFASAEDAQLYLPAAEPVPADVVLGHDVAAGELLPVSALQPPSIPSAELPLAVPNGSLPADLAPGERVDVWVAPDPSSVGAGRGGGTGRAVRVLSGVSVVSLETADTALGGGDATRVLVALDDAAAASLDVTLARLATGSPVLVRLGG